jgi:hypothetical protein
MKRITQRLVLLSLLVIGPVVAHADSVNFDYSAYSKFFDAVFARESGPLIYEEDKAPLYVLQRFIVEGVSTDEWTEALEIMSTQRKNEPENVRGWYDRFQAQGEKTCPGDWEILKESKKELTFERSVNNCDPLGTQHALYKVLYGKREVFVLIATRKAQMDAGTRDGWIDLLKSAEISR